MPSNAKKEKAYAQLRHNYTFFTCPEIVNSLIFHPFCKCNKIKKEINTFKNKVQIPVPIIGPICCVIIR